ncbi:hypothetical protein BDZ45DRAFT_418709 [Acephala macrosclerotiorum]|nr:hypothetical protein BDZ45DRAFT_418709 [Acephala macrosclerotiorum]
MRSTASGRTKVSPFVWYQSTFIRLSKTTPKTQQLSEITKDGAALYTTKSYPAFTTTPWVNVSGTWTITLRAKPEVAGYGSTSYVFYPPVSSAYGKGHSAAGLYFALNGLELVEASTSTPTIIATVPGYYTGDWTHIATVLSPSQISALASASVPPPYLPKAVTPTSSSDLLIRENGTYELTTSTNATTTLSVSSCKASVLSSPWKVAFPSQFMPKNTSTLSIALPQLQSL